MEEASRFAGKVAIVTGAGNGIGAATVRRFQREGARVVVVDVDETAGRAMADSLPQGSAIFARADIGNLADVEAMVEAAVSAFGGVDILVNNAAVFAGMGMETQDLDPQLWERTVRVIQTGTFYCCRSAIPRMRERGGGAIVNIGSVSAMGGDAGMSAYNAAKGAVLNYTRTLAIDHGRHGIRVNAVCPGPVVTSRSMITRPDVEAVFLPAIPLRRYAGPDDIAAAVAFLASNDAAMISGAVLPVDGGLTAGSGQPDLVPFLQESRAHSAAAIIGDKTQ